MVDPFRDDSPQVEIARAEQEAIEKRAARRAALNERRPRRWEGLAVRLGVMLVFAVIAATWLAVRWLIAHFVR